MVLVEKWAYLQVFFFSQYKPGKCLLPYSGLKNTFLGYKSTSSNTGKIAIFSHGFGSKNDHFYNFFLSQYKPEKSLFRYSKTKKRISRL